MMTRWIHELSPTVTSLPLIVMSVLNSEQLPDYHHLSYATYKFLIIKTQYLVLTSFIPDHIML